jgi:hypothetical protein
MSDSNSAGFGQFVPGFDFLQNLAKGQGAQMHGLGSWVAPTFDPQELDKRIGELKSVQFWLDQNAAALKATIQALEVQKMTLATLKGMNLDMNAMGQAFQFPAAASAKPQSAAKSDAAVDPMQLWGALAQQFQQIATGVLQEVAKQAAAAASPATKSGASDAGSKKAAAPKAKAAKKPQARSR